MVNLMLHEILYACLIQDCCLTMENNLKLEFCPSYDVGNMLLLLRVISGFCHVWSSILQLTAKKHVNFSCLSLHMNKEN